MSDIFISYSSKDRQWVNILASRLKKLGFSVWFDTDLLAGQKFHNQIQEKLETAKCIIVVWSEASVKSDWVKAEANRAFSKNNMIPILIDKAKIPLPFDSIHTVALTSWSAVDAEIEFNKITNSIDKSLVNIDNSINYINVKVKEPFMLQPYFMVITIFFLLIMLLFFKDYLVSILKMSVINN